VGAKDGLRLVQGKEEFAAFFPGREVAAHDLAGKFVSIHEGVASAEPMKPLLRGKPFHLCNFEHEKLIITTV